MNNYLRNIYLLIIALFSFAFANAQDDTTLIKEVTVSQAYNPTVNDAFKLGKTPSIATPQSYTPSFDYSFYNAPLTTSYEIQMLSAEPCEPKMPKNKWHQNYIKGGGGNYSTLLGELFYNAYNSDIQNVNIFYRNKSSWGKVHLQDDARVYAPLFINQGKVDFQRRYRRSVLSTSLLFDRTAYEYYGYQTLNKSLTYSHADGANYVADQGRQSIMDFGIETTLASINSARSEIRHKTSLAFHSLSNDDKYAENLISLSSGFSKDMKKVVWGFDGHVNLGLYSKADPSISRAYNEETLVGLDVAQHLTWQKRNWNLKVGVRFDYFYRDVIEEVNVAPVLDFNFNIVPKYFTVLLRAKGALCKTPMLKL